MQEFVAAFHPVFIITKKMQEVQMTMGEFYYLWLECMIDLQAVNNSLSKSMLDAIEKRNIKLFNNDAFLAAL